MSVDLCVINHTTKPLLERLLDTLHQDDDSKTWDLYIVDSGSTDGSDEYLSVEVPIYYRVKGGWCTDNVGYAAACNFAAAQGTGDIIGLLNADVWMTTDDVRRIEAAFQEDAEVAIIGPKQRNEQNFITHAGIVGSPTSPEMRGWREHDPTDHLYRDRVSCVTVSGSAYFIRRSTWQELTECPTYRSTVAAMGSTGIPGAFLPTKHYYEETWCSYHARAHDWKVVYEGGVSIGHTWHASSPVGSLADQQFETSRKAFRGACARHNIPCD
jgi:glycosyltransferase involved in cell wall biosynthesis